MDGLRAREQSPLSAQARSVGAAGTTRELGVLRARRAGHLDSRLAQNVRVRPNDTTAAAHAVHLDAYRRAGPARRAEIAAELSEASRELSRAGVRMRHPELSEDEVTREVCRIFYGELRRERGGR